MSGIRIKAKMKGDRAEVKVIAKHPMETGTAKDKEGNKIPAHYIETISAEVNGQKVFSGDLGPAISKNPYLKFFYKGAKGDKVTISWVDNKGQTDAAVGEVK